MRKRLSVIIVAYNAVNVLRQCIDSILKYNDIGSELEIIISDNSPGMDVLDSIKETYKDVEIIHNEKNLGFGYGNNQGEKIATGEYLLFLNPDTILIEPVFSWAIDQFERNSKLAMFGVQLLKPDYTRNNSFMLLDTFGIQSWILNKVCQRANLFIENRMFTSGADLFIRKTVFQQIGRFDENIFMYYEESDLVHRMLATNREWETGYFPKKKIIHLEGGTKDSEEKIIASYKRQLDTFKYYCEKHDVDFEKSIKSEMLLDEIQRKKYKVMRQKDKYELKCKIISILKSSLVDTV